MCDGVLHVASKNVCQQHYSSQAVVLDYASKSAFVFLYLGRDDSCLVGACKISRLVLLSTHNIRFHMRIYQCIYACRVELA